MRRLTPIKATKPEMLSDILRTHMTTERERTNSPMSSVHHGTHSPCSK